MNALTLYAGAGGADLGLHAAGLEHVACVDADADCVATLLAAGLPGVRAGIGGPWAGAPALDVSPYVGVDVVWASPPCQPYSRAGKGLGADDPRDGWPHTLGAVRLVRPRWVVVENVSGAPVEKWTADLRELGYTVSAWTLDAADYGVPQNRVREFIVAGPVAVPSPRPTHSLYALAEAKWRTGAYWHRHGIAPVGEPTRKEERALGRLLDPGRGLLPWRTMRDALPGLVAPVWTSQTSDRVAAAVGGKGTHYAHAGDPGVRHGPPTRRASEPDRLDRPAPTVATTEEKGTRAHGNPPDFNGGPDRASDAAWLAVGRRRLTVEECAVLQDFPVGHPFQGTKTSRYRQVGNAVCPRVAEVIARAVLAADATLTAEAAK